MFLLAVIIALVLFFPVPLCENLTFQGHAFLGHHLAEGQKYTPFFKKKKSSIFLQNDN